MGRTPEGANPFVMDARVPEGACQASKERVKDTQCDWPASMSTEQQDEQGHVASNTTR